jgi:Transmembrane domain of unknown function (DUF3566)
MAKRPMRTNLEIKRLELWSIFKLAFMVYAVIGLVVGAFYGLFLLVAGAITSFSDEVPRLGALSGVLGVVLIPLIAIFYGAVGSVFVTIAGLLYNVFAGMVGGLRFEAQVDVGPSPSVASVPEHADGEDQPPTI